MITEELDGQRLAAEGSASQGGFIDGFLLAIDRLPGPAAVAYLVIAVAMALIGQLTVWATGASLLGTFRAEVLIPPFLFAWFLWLIHTLNRVAISSYDQFRPAFGDPSSESRYRRQLTSIRDRDALLAGIAASIVLMTTYYSFVRPPGGFVAFGIELAEAAFWFLTAMALGVVVLHTVNQLRLVSRLSAIARNVDIFKPGPINAFSRLTAVSAVGLIASVVALIAYGPDQPVAYVVQEVALLALAVATFVLPLRVMHERLADEKSHLKDDAQDRLKALLVEVHATIEHKDLNRSEQLNYALRSQMTEIEVLDRLRTWPWSTATIRGFVSALLLPIALIVTSQVIAKLI